MLIPFKSMPTSLIRGIVHVGAHEAEELSDYLVSGIEHVLWVEANPSKWSLLEEKIAGFPLMSLGRFAASPQTGGSALLNIANNGQSSSLLSLGTHADHYPSIEYSHTESVPLIAVDDWIDQLGSNRSTLNFINLDIQGYELDALRGLGRQLAFTDFIYTEVNFEEVYVGCALLDDLDRYLRVFGFSRVALVDTGAGWGDALYAKRNLALLKLRFQGLLLAGIFYKVLRKIFRLLARPFLSVNLISFSGN